MHTLKCGSTPPPRFRTLLRSRSRNLTICASTKRWDCSSETRNKRKLGALGHLLCSGAIAYVTASTVLITPLQAVAAQPAPVNREEQRYVKVDRKLLESLLAAELRERLELLSDDELVRLLGALISSPSSSPALPADLLRPPTTQPTISGLPQAATPTPSAPSDAEWNAQTAPDQPPLPVEAEKREVSVGRLPQGRRTGSDTGGGVPQQQQHEEQQETPLWMSGVTGLKDWLRGTNGAPEDTGAQGGLELPSAGGSIVPPQLPQLPQLPQPFSSEGVASGSLPEPVPSSPPSSQKLPDSVPEMASGEGDKAGSGPIDTVGTGVTDRVGTGVDAGTSWRTAMENISQAASLKFQGMEAQRTKVIYGTLGSVAVATSGLLFILLRSPSFRAQSQGPQSSSPSPQGSPPDAPSSGGQRRVQIPNPSTNLSQGPASYGGGSSGSGGQQVAVQDRSSASSGDAVGKPASGILGSIMRWFVVPEEVPADPHVEGIRDAGEAALPTPSAPYQPPQTNNGRMEKSESQLEESVPAGLRRRWSVGQPSRQSLLEWNGEEMTGLPTGRLDYAPKSQTQLPRSRSGSSSPPPSSSPRIPPQPLPDPTRYPPSPPLPASASSGVLWVRDNTDTPPRGGSTAPRKSSGTPETGAPGGVLWRRREEADVGVGPGGQGPAGLRQSGNGEVLWVRKDVHFDEDRSPGYADSSSSGTVGHGQLPAESARFEDPWRTPRPMPPEDANGS